LPSNTTVQLVFLILKATCFGPSDHRLAILRKFKSHAVQSCSTGSHTTYSYIAVYEKYYKLHNIV